MSSRTLIILGAIVGGIAAPLFSQQAAKVEQLTISDIQKRIAVYNQKKDLPAAVKDPVLSFLERGVERLEISQEQAKKADEFERKLLQVADQLQKSTKELRSLPSTADTSVIDIEGIDELEHTVELLSKQIDDPDTGLKKKVSALEEEAELRRVRPEQLMTELVEVEDRLREIEEELEEASASGEGRDLMVAHQVFLLCRRQRAESERRALQAESAWYESGTAADLLDTQQELETKTLTLRTAELEILQKELVKRRGDEADQRVRRAQVSLNGVSADLKPIAERNLALAIEHREVTHKLHENSGRRETMSNSFNELEKEFATTRKMTKKMKDAPDAIGQLLRQQRTKLADVRMIRSNLSHRNDIMRDVRMRQFQLGLDIDSLIDLDAAAVKQAEEVDAAKQNKSVAAGLKKLLGEQRELLKDLESEYRKYLSELLEMDVVDKGSLKLTTEFSNYIDERVLWIRSGQMFNIDQVTKLTKSLQWLTDRKSWNAVVEAIRVDISRRTLTWISAAACLVLWVFLNPILRGLLRNRGHVASQLNCRDLGPTLQSVAITFFLAAGLPCVLWFVGYRLDHGASSSPFVHAFAAGLHRIAMFALPLEMIRVICFRGGVGELHFDWPLELVNRWRRNLNWFLPVSGVLIGLIGFVEGTADEHRMDSVGRSTYLVFTLLACIFSMIVIRRSGIRATTPDGYVAPDSDVWSERFWKYTPRLAISICIGLFALGFSGYFYTALQLTWRIEQTAWLAVGLILLRSVIRRWIALERRRMAILQDEELQSITESARAPGVSGHNTFLFPRWHWPDFRLNLTQIVTQMRRLLDTGLITAGLIGLWVVWADVTPALNILDSFTLWETTVEANISVADGEDGFVSQLIKRPKKVTAADMGLALVVVGIAVIAGRNIPGLVEVILLEHLSVDAGARFAVTCLVRYVIFTVGVIFAFSQISIGWANVQWLVAAASVGLGFGLQEIFGNFVSGIILLFERPMRVGDVVTIGDTTGTISRIRFRATTILDGDRKELIVPNKEFITGKLLNWTLSDRVNRVTVKVMVSGGNDPQKVRKVLLDVATHHPLLLKEPAPSATLEDLNGGLTFILRGFLAALDGRSTAIHDLYAMIHDRFRLEGIEMPCPSQEVFVRMDRMESTPMSSPHAPLPGVPAKSAQTDATAAFRRA